MQLAEVSSEELYHNRFGARAPGIYITFVWNKLKKEIISLPCYGPEGELYKLCRVELQMYLINTVEVYQYTSALDGWMSVFCLASPPSSRNFPEGLDFTLVKLNVFASGSALVLPQIIFTCVWL